MSDKVDFDGRGRILEAWQPPLEAGNAVGCLATTFTFDASFFEEKCLTSFLAMETDPAEQGAAYIIERAERLRETYAGVMVDRRNARCERPLYWDLLPVNVAGASMHAKVSLLAWKNCVRLIIGSANLTDVAYRNNLELYGVLDFEDNCRPPLEELRRAIDFIEGVLTLTPEGPAREHAAIFLKRVRSLIRGWRQLRRQRSDPRIQLIFGGMVRGKRYSALEAATENVRRNGGAARKAWVVSPFFDTNNDAAANALRDRMTQQGPRDITFTVDCEEEDSRWLIRVPKRLHKALPHADFQPVAHAENEELRQLHAKGVWLENYKWVAYMIGSSNFTRAGMGVGSGPRNVEANIAYSALCGSRTVRNLNMAYPAAEEIIYDLNKAVWEPVRDPDANENPLLPSLPIAFSDATFRAAGEAGLLKLSFQGKQPLRWSIRQNNDEGVLYDSQKWKADGSPRHVELEWKGTAPPSMIMVRWIGGDRKEYSAPWIVNVHDRSELPPPDELRNLSFDTLLELLSTARPLHEAMRQIKDRESRRHEQGARTVNLDPHRRVSTELFLLQRTRRISKALEQLRQRLERPVQSTEALFWRLRGPVGPEALMKAIQNDYAERMEGREGGLPSAIKRITEGEVAFLLAEIALTLGRVRISKDPSSISRRLVKGEYRKLIRELRKEANAYLRLAPVEMQKYVVRAFTEARR